MKKNKKIIILDSEEALLEKELENIDFLDDPDFLNTKNMLQEAAKQYVTLNTSKPVTIRVNQLDLIKVKAKAKAKNIPYQTLLGALIHEYADGERSITL